MSQKKKRPLPPRTLRMARAARLQSARLWLAMQRGRPAERIARSYRKRFGVDWPCAIAELTMLGIRFPAEWREQIARTLENARLAKARRRAERSRATASADADEADSDEHFAFIAGYTEGGAPYGVTWEEREGDEKSGRSTASERSPGIAPQRLDDEDQLPF